MKKLGKIERRILLFLTTLVVIGGVALLFWANKSAGVKAAWFDDSWGYRQVSAGIHAGSAQTNYQIMITMDTSTLITAGKMQSDCDDVRVVDDQGKVLPHWIETGAG